jgi:hypothetical protein
LIIFLPEQTVGKTMQQALLTIDAQSPLVDLEIEIDRKALFDAVRGAVDL